MSASGIVTAEQWSRFDELGFFIMEASQVFGEELAGEGLGSLQKRIDEIMLGTAAGVQYDSLMMQLDSSTGKYEDSGEQTLGHKGATLAYRKIQNLEHDATFMHYLRRPLFLHICRRVYGSGVPVSSFRTMFFNKPAGKGTELPWHQDRWKYLDVDPLVTVYTALDAATPQSGCVQIVPGSHKWGVINPSHPSGFLTAEQVSELELDQKAVPLELEPGNVAVLHNWTLHKSGVNPTGAPRRALSVNYMVGNTTFDREAFGSQGSTGTTAGYPEGADVGFKTIFEAHE